MADAILTEEWRDVVGYERLYEVSSFGGVRNARNKRPLREHPDEDGYARVYLSAPLDGGGHKVKRRGVHQLVATAFVGPKPAPGHEVNHEDGVKANNRSDNLTWMTPLENQQHATRTGLKASGERHGRVLHPEWWPPAGDPKWKKTRPRITGENHYSRSHPEFVARGDRNGARLHPEKLARGERNGAYTHPEQVRKGSQQGRAKLVEADIPVIRALLATMSQDAIGKRYGVSQAVISGIKRKVLWAHVPD